VGRDDIKLEKSALLYGLRGIKGGKSIELFPYSGYRNSVSGDEKDSKFAAGLDARYSLTSNINLDVTVSPDFSEVDLIPSSTSSLLTNTISERSALFSRKQGAI
jgi:hypothetical protein